MQISDITKKYWTDEDWNDLENCATAHDMYVIASRIAKRMPQPIAQVCGPIATGGRGSLEANLDVFNETIQSLQANGIHVFDQMPFEMPMQKLKKTLVGVDGVTSILDDFYAPLFLGGDITTFYFMPGWETSKGATWEHDQLTKKGSTIIYL